MINITQFFRDNFSENNYYGYSFSYLKYLDDIPEYTYFDIDDLISNFKDLLDPINEKKITMAIQDKFILMCFYFYKNGYIIEQFPKLFERPHKEKSYPLFMNNEIRNFIMKERNDFVNVVRWDERRKLISELKFIKKDIYDDSIEEIIKKITTGDKSFNDMKVDDKLHHIADAIEYLLKENGSFIVIDFNNLSDVIDNSEITIFRKKIQCFRHASEESVNERKMYSEVEKKAMVNFGVFVINTVLDFKH